MSGDSPLPRHYRTSMRDQWAAGDFIRRMGLGFDEGNVVKYVVRHRQKGGPDDLLKAIEYLRHMLSRDYGVETGDVVSSIPDR